jgi:hypothetical protein
LIQRVLTTETVPLDDAIPLPAAFPPSSRKNGDANKLRPEDRPVHDWYRFVLSYPPHFVRDYLKRLGAEPGHTVLDPFCGTGTTLVECKKLGLAGVGIESNPMAHLASHVKTEWSPDPDGLARHAESVAEETMVALLSGGAAACSEQHEVEIDGRRLRTLDPERMGLLLRGSISPVPLHKSLVLLDQLARLRDDRYHGHELLALAKILVFSASNLSFGPEVGVGRLKHDAYVVEAWVSAVRTMARDLRNLSARQGAPCVAHKGDSRESLGLLEPKSIDIVITSPPYPNEKDYTRTTRLESVLLGLINTKAELRALKQGLVRSNTRGVYKADDDDKWIQGHPEILRIADQIEARRIELGKTSGFERLYARVTKLYFGGMARHLADLRSALRPGARLGYVVGDQASYLRVMIRTGQILAEIAQSLGYEVIGIDLFRTRLATATKEQLREEVLVLRWPG